LPQALGFAAFSTDFNRFSWPLEVDLMAHLVRGADKVKAMNPKQLQSLAVLALAMVPVVVLWWVWIRMLD
jgi:hypothetical protein